MKTTQDTDRRLRARAVLLSLGDHAVLVGEAAAWWWGLRDRAPDRAEVAVGHECHQRPRPDALFPAQRVIVEIDGWAYHRGLRAFLIDGPRRTALTAEGWTVVRTHRYELVETPEVLVGNLCRPDIEGA